ncbi:MAG: branched-chain amino acid ABC transporter permease [Paracoccaceae bacterium]
MPWIIAAIVLLVLPIFLGSRSQLTILSQMGITMVFALAYNMLLGQGGMLSFGHAVYMGLGSFMCLHVMNANFFEYLPLPLLPLIGGMFGLGFALIIGSFSTRSAGTVFAMISLGIGELFAALVLIVTVFFGGEEGISGYRDEGLPVLGIEFISNIEVYYLVAIWLFISTVLMFLFSRTPVGRMANAVRDNPERAQFLGYSARWVRFVSFAVSGFFCGVAGGLSAILFEIATETDLNVAASGAILLITFLGGVAFFWGPIIGAIVFTLLQTVLGLQTHLWELYLGVVFVGVVMFFPFGLSGIIMAHAPAAKMGRLGMLVVPYLTCVLPAIIGVLGIASLVEMIFHVRSGAEGEHDMTLFWIDFSTHDVLPWVVALAVAVIGIGLARRNAPAFKAAWETANHIPEAV